MRYGLHYAPELTKDTSWARHIEKQWSPRVIWDLLDPLPGLEIEPTSEQSQFKISYYIDSPKAPSLEEINQLLHQEEQSTNVILSVGQFLDVLPLRGPKGLALRYVATRWGIPFDRILVANGSGADEDRLHGNTLAAVVRAPDQQEPSRRAEFDRIYFTEAIGHCGFFDDMDVDVEVSQ
ncbi:MAG: sucrose-phosphate synthase [Gammaproteobacteria bacterium]